MPGIPVPAGSAGSTYTITYADVRWQWPLVVTTSGTSMPQPWQYIGTNSTASYQLQPGWTWGIPPPPPESAADRAAREQRQAVYAREAEVRRQARLRASTRAEELLLSLLGPDQAASYTRDGWFEVRGSAGGLFRVSRRGQAGNIDELPAPGAPRIASYCAHPAGGFPDADAHVAQFLRLVTDEEGFRQVANRTPRRRIAA